jgi:hypothetical protein
MNKLFGMVLVLAFIGCGTKTEKAPEFTKQQIAEQSVREYIWENTNDSASYQPISFDSLRFENDLPSDHSKGYWINHAYRAANKMGGVQKYYRMFFLDTTLKVVKVY